MADRQGGFGAEGSRVQAAEVAVADIGLPVVDGIIGEVDLVEEPRFDVVGIGQRAEKVLVVVVVVPGMAPNGGIVVVDVEVAEPAMELDALFPNSTPAMPSRVNCPT